MRMGIKKNCGSHISRRSGAQAKQRGTNKECWVKLIHVRGFLMLQRQRCLEIALPSYRRTAMANN